MHAVNFVRLKISPTPQNKYSLSFGIILEELDILKTRAHIKNDFTSVLFVQNLDFLWLGKQYFVGFISW